MNAWTVSLLSGFLTATAVIETGCGASATPTSPSNASGTYTSSHFSFDYTPLDAATITSTAASVETQYDRILSELGVASTGSMPRVTVTFYTEHAALEAAGQPVIGYVPAWTAGFVTSESRIHLMSPSLPSWGPYERMVSNIVHEFAHCVSLHVNSRFANNPRWLWESVAIYESRQFVDPRTLPYIQAHAPPTIAQLNSIDNTAIYDVGFTIGEFIVSRWGQGTFHALIAASGDVDRVLGIAADELLRDWFAFVQVKYGV